MTGFFWSWWKRGLELGNYGYRNEHDGISQFLNTIGMEYGVLKIGRVWSSGLLELANERGYDLEMNTTLL
jgi:hypothetical protein